MSLQNETAAAVAAATAGDIAGVGAGTQANHPAHAAPLSSAALPHVLGVIDRAIGPVAVARLIDIAEATSGSRRKRIYVPARQSGKTWDRLVASIGPDAAGWFQRTYAGEDLVLPVRAYRRGQRRQAAGMDVLAGVHPVVAAARHRVSRRTAGRGALMIGSAA